MIAMILMLQVAALLTYSNAVMVNTRTSSNNTNYDNFNDTAGNIWMHCWQVEGSMGDMTQMGVLMASCIKHKLYEGLVESTDQQCVNIGDGVTFESENESLISPRELFPLGEEPSSFRELADAYSSFLSRRGIRWDLGYLYPGLVMKVGPTLNAAGVIEFVMDRNLDYQDRVNLSPGQLMVRRTILPRLLGFRMNLLQLLPLAFGIMVYVAKNAFIFSKITLIISTLLALKSLFVLQHLRTPHHGHEFDHVAEPFPIGGPRPQPHSLHSPGQLILQMFSGAVPPFRGVNDKHFDEPYRFDNNLPPRPEEFRDFKDTSEQYRGKRNFAWEKGT